MLFSAIAAVTVLVVSCQKENKPDESQSDIYEQVGVLHNEGLDLFIQKIDAYNDKTKAPHGTPIAKDILSNIQQEVNAEMVAKLYGTNVHDTKVTDITTSLSYMCFNTKSNSMPEQNLSVNQKAFMDKLIKISKVIDYKNYADIEKAVRKIEKQMESKCSKEEMSVIRVMASIAVYSSEYWARNYDRWGEILLGAEKANMTKVLTKSGNEMNDGRGIWISDVVGAAAGAIKGGMAGAAGGTVVVPGVGTAGGAAVGAIGGGLSGGLSASVTAGLVDWIGSWWD